MFSSGISGSRTPKSDCYVPEALQTTNIHASQAYRMVILVIGTCNFIPRRSQNRMVSDQTQKLEALYVSQNLKSHRNECQRIWIAEQGTASHDRRF